MKNGVLSLTDRLRAYFEAHPDTWIDGRELSKIAGAYGWRTRASECRQRGLHIINRVRWIQPSTEGIRKYKVSEYKLVTQADQAQAS